MWIFPIGVLAFFLRICVGDQSGNPRLLTKPYVAPWASLPDTPSLPTAIDSGYVHVDNETAIWYSFYGQQLSQTLGRGQIPVLFLHGGFANSDYFGHQIAALNNQPFTLIAIDSRGQGRSTDGSGPITYDRMTGDVLAVLDHFHIPKVALVGWSDGAIIGFDIAMNYSSRLDRLFSFGGSYSFSNGNTTLDANPIFNTYMQRTELEYKRLNPNPADWPQLSDKMNQMWSTLPSWDERSFGRIPTLYADPSAPLVWILDGDSEEVVNRTVPAVLHDWISVSDPWFGFDPFTQRQPLRWLAQLLHVNRIENSAGVDLALTRPAGPRSGTSTRTSEGPLGVTASTLIDLSIARGGRQRLYRWQFGLPNPFPGSVFSYATGYHFVELMYQFMMLSARLHTHRNHFLQRQGEEIARSWIRFANGLPPMPGARPYDLEEGSIMIYDVLRGWTVRTRAENEVISQNDPWGPRRYHQ
ncbi:unnamed protein product [Penicillium glandicola]